MDCCCCCCRRQVLWECRGQQQSSSWILISPPSFTRRRSISSHTLQRSSSLLSSSALTICTDFQTRISVRQSRRRRKKQHCGGDGAAAAVRKSLGPYSDYSNSNNSSRNVPDTSESLELKERQQQQEEGGGAGAGLPQLLLQERRSGIVVSRYRVDKQSGSWCKESSESIDSSSSVAGEFFMQEEEEDHAQDLGLPFQVPQNLRNFFLPSGFPDSVSDDYMPYMLWQFPTNVTGWICSTLVTSSLLKAVGIGGDGSSAAAAAAAIKWVSKDGLGTVGRLFIGGRFGSLFDEDPKQWRMYADFIGSAGSIFELATPLAPGAFLLLASLGNLTKATAKGLKDPSFRVIQNHFAVSENVGDVAAKEEVWGVAGQLVGLAFGVLLLRTPGVSTSYWELVATWACIRSLHLWLRYQTLGVLCFSTINYKRAVILIEAHLSGIPLPGWEECNLAEQLLVPRFFLKPQIRVGRSLEELFGPSPSKLKVEELLSLYQLEKHVLVLHPNPLHGLEARILLKEGASNMTLLRGLYQACWLLQQKPQSSGDSTASLHLGAAGNGNSRCDMKDQQEQLRRSVEVLQQDFNVFVQGMQEQGWEMPLEELLFTVNPEKFTNFSAQDFLKASYSISPRNIDKRNIGISKFFKPTRHKEKAPRN
ncbi:hypothetical protein BDL97_12G029800 [Sphagnum fallax]|nr:hypothetical protein BDL97_12G029800 [Sphagnum fallax]